MLISGRQKSKVGEKVLRFKEVALKQSMEWGEEEGITPGCNDLSTQQINIEHLVSVWCKLSSGKKKEIGLPGFQELTVLAEAQTIATHGARGMTEVASGTMGTES